MIGRETVAHRGKMSEPRFPPILLQCHDEPFTTYALATLRGITTRG
jgi:hypothetical protein